MKDESLLGPWVRRFLLEHLVAERNLSHNTQASYRDSRPMTAKGLNGTQRRQRLSITRPAPLYWMRPSARERPCPVAHPQDLAAADWARSPSMP
jgi:hypothetical protein